MQQSADVGVRYIEVEEGADGQRLDNFLGTRLKGVPRSLLYRLLRTGQVRVNGGRVKADLRLAVGDRVRIPPVQTRNESSADAPLPRSLVERLQQAVLFEDRDLLVIDKPSGLASHGGSGLSFGAIEAMRKLRPDIEKLELVHRLDRETSGVLLLAKRRSALARLHAAIRDGRVRKTYLALLSGRLRRDRVRVDLPLDVDGRRGGERHVEVSATGKEARTEFRVLRKTRAASYCEVELDTGRTHQIRVHAAHLGHPLAGDERYGDAGFNQRMRELGLKRLFLHARSFEIPGDGERDSILLHAPLPADLTALLERLD